MAHNRKRVHPKPQGKTDKYVTQQQFRDDANINTMLGRHMKGPGRMGLPIGNPNATRQPRFEYQPSETFHEMLNMVTDAQNAFRALPARTRGRFSNDPYQLLRFLENPENRAEAEKLGLVDPKDPFNYLGVSNTTADLNPRLKAFLDLPIEKRDSLLESFHAHLGTDPEVNTLQGGKS